MQQSTSIIFENEFNEVVVAPKVFETYTQEDDEMSSSVVPDISETLIQKTIETSPSVLEKLI